MIAVAALLLALADMYACPPGSTTVSAAAYYSQALSTMRELPMPSAMEFNVLVRAAGVGVQLNEEPQGYGSLNAGFGSAFAGTGEWRTTYDRSMNRSTIERPSDSSLIAVSAIFNPTWLGAYDWMRYGLHRQAPVEVTPSPLRDASSGMKEITVVTAANPGAYDVAYAGDEQCPSGVPGRRLHLQARVDRGAHPLTDIVVDPATMRFCSMRFNVGAASGLSLTGSVELHFGDVQGYWLVNDATSDLLVRIFGLGVKHAHLSVQYSNIAIQANAL